MNDEGTRESLTEMCEVLFLTKEQREVTRLLRCHHCRHSFRAPRTGRTPLGCSIPCKKAIQKARQAANKQAYKSKELLRQCAWCLQLFTVTNHKKKKYCNVGCAGKYRHWAGVSIPVTIKERVLQLLEAA